MDILSDVLSLMKLKGTLYFRTSFTSPWGVTVPSFQNVSRFHYAHRGRCYALVDGVDDPVLLEQGDLVIITRGAGHTLCCDIKNVEAKLLDQVVSESGFTGSGVLVYGEPGTDLETQLICGHFAFDPEAHHPLVDALPPVIHVRNYGDTAHSWLEATLRVIGGEAGRGELGGDLIAMKLTEIIFAQAIRTYLATEGQDRLVFGAIANPNIRRALEAVHGDPAKAWTVDALAREAGLSRTSFAASFKQLMAVTPHQYITSWRMQMARRLLTETELPMIEIAERSGYTSEAAFGRVYKKHFGVPPASYRRRRELDGTVTDAGTRASGAPDRAGSVQNVETGVAGRIVRTWNKMRGQVTQDQERPGGQ